MLTTLLLPTPLLAVCTWSKESHTSQAQARAQARPGPGPICVVGPGSGYSQALTRTDQTEARAFEPNSTRTTLPAVAWNCEHHAYCPGP
ncbi:hypothetical protein DFH08DRAFT_866809, partial [Mycena albidolilacea]